MIKVQIASDYGLTLSEVAPDRRRYGYPKAMSFSFAALDPDISGCMHQPVWIMRSEVFGQSCSKSWADHGLQSLQCPEFHNSPYTVDSRQAALWDEVTPGQWQAVGAAEVDPSGLRGWSLGAGDRNRNQTWQAAAPTAAEPEEP